MSGASFRKRGYLEGKGSASRPLAFPTPPISEVLALKGNLPKSFADSFEPASMRGMDGFQEAVDNLHVALQSKIEELMEWFATLPHAPLGTHWEIDHEASTWGNSIPDIGADSVTLHVVAHLVADRPPLDPEGLIE